ncbi:hypothetical protein [Streptosporangium saharense]|uniref:hypothetical protein n=1 Tax=Streptosporangium saharense TaxID=1706840 RepID=UPI0036AE499D
MPTRRGGTAGEVGSAAFARLGELGPGDAESSRSRASSGCAARRMGGGSDWSPAGAASTR